jgi:hypothetical protein
LNERIDRYTADLGGNVRRAIAAMLGHDDLPRLEIPAPPD